MRVVVVTNILAPYRIPLFIEIRKRVASLDVVLQAESEENRQWTIPDHDINCHILKGVHYRPPGSRFSMHFNWGMVRLLHRLDPDVVISGGFTVANGAGLLYCKLFGKKHLSFGELSFRHDIRGASPVKQMVRRIIIGSSHGFWASTSEASRVFAFYGAREDAVLTCPMPVHVDYFRCQANAFRSSDGHTALKNSYSAPVLTYVGHLTDLKGVPQLFEIYGEVLTEYPEATLLVIGEGISRSGYEAFVQSKGWRRVCFLGFLGMERLVKYLAISDLFIFPSFGDPFGAVVPEAMAAGVPVASSVHACVTPDLVRHGVDGYHIDPAHPKEAAATVLAALKMTPEQRLAMVQAARRSAEQCRFEMAAQRLIEHIERLNQEVKR